MDKNMINIDDLFKQRLSGGENDERPGAWLQMREMLDQKMPVTPPPAGSTFNWRRMLGVLAGVATLSVVSVGGYEMVTSFRQGNNTAGNGPVVASTGNAGSAHTARIAANSQQQFNGHTANTNANTTGSDAHVTGTNNGNGQAINNGTGTNGGNSNATSAANTIAGKGNNANNSGTGNTAGTGNTSRRGTGNTIAANTTNTATGATIANNTGDNTASAADRNTIANNAPVVDNNNNTTPAGNTMQDNRSNGADLASATGNGNSTNNNQSNESLNTSDNNNNAGNSFGAIAANNPSVSANRDETSSATTSNNSNTGTTRNRGTLDRKNTTQKKNVFSSAATAKAGNNTLPVASGTNGANGKSGNDAGNSTAGNKTGKAKTNNTANNTAKTGTGSNKAKTNAGGNTAANNSAKGNTGTGSINKNNSIKPTVEPSVTDNTATSATYTLVKEPIRKIEILERYSKGGALKIDTIFNGTVEIDKYIASAAKQSGDEQSLQASAANATVAANKSEVKEELVPLQKYRTSHNKQPLWEPRRFEEMVQNAKLNMSSVRFYPGLIAGVNTLMSGKNSMTGFQLGLSGTLSLNERWALFTELKYVHRFNSGTLDYKSDITTQSIVNGTTTYTITPKTKQFSFPSLSSMELPIAVRYTLNRINIFMGVNYAYYFATNPSLIEINEAPVTTTVEPTVDPNAINLAATDFSSRYGVGYMLGMGYHFTPAVHVDLRLAHSVWDNANTNGTRYVSQNLFRVPTLQVNFNYRFSSKNKMR